MIGFVAAIMLVVVVIFSILQKPMAYSGAIKMMERGNYASAAEQFEKLEDYKDSVMGVKYAQVMRGFSKNRYYESVKALEELKGYFDVDWYLKIMREYNGVYVPEIDGSGYKKIVVDDSGMKLTSQSGKLSELSLYWRIKDSQLLGPNYIYSSRLLSSCFDGNVLVYKGVRYIKQ